MPAASLKAPFAAPRLPSTAATFHTIRAVVLSMAVGLFVRHLTFLVCSVSHAANLTRAVATDRWSLPLASSVNRTIFLLRDLKSTSALSRRDLPRFQ